MKIVYSSDYHLDVSTAGVLRCAELARAVDHVVNYAIVKRADIFVFGGDLMNPDAGSIVFEAMRITLAAANRLSMMGVCSFWLSGNHDVVEDGSGRTSLEPLKSCSPLVRVVDRPESMLIDGVHFTFLPFTASSHPYNPEEFVRENVSTEAPHHVIISHLTHVRGISPGEESIDMARGRSLSLPDECIVERRQGRAMTVLSGHFHRGGTYETPAGLSVHVPGSLARLRFGPEEDIDPAFIVVDV